MSRLSDNASLVLLALGLAAASAGDRIGDVGISTSLLRSVHATDFVAIGVAVLVLVKFGVIAAALGQAATLAAIAWVGYVFTLGQSGHYMTGLIHGHGAVVGPAFALKETGYVLFLCLGVYAGSRSARTTRLLILLTSITLFAWLVVELATPTGYYLVGLPFEAGAVQTGSVYATLAIAALSLRDYENASFTRRLAILVTGVSLLAGALLSLSRSVAAGLLLAGLSRLAIGKRLRAIAISMMILCILAAVTASIYETSPELLVIVAERWVDVDLHVAYRLAKWSQLWTYLEARPWLLFFGAGLGSPNYLVLGPELGVLLAVDSGYVRRVFEVGFLGTALYGSFLLTLVMRARRLGVLDVVLPLTAVMLGAALTLESFQVSQTANLYMLIIGSFLGMATRQPVLRSAAPALSGPVADRMYASQQR